MEDLLKFLVDSISKDLDYEIVKTEEEGNILYTLIVPKEVMGIFIGKQGKTINALRTIIKARATLEDIRVNLELQEKE